MTDRKLDRRDFNKYTAAAFGGVLCGSLAGCGGKKEPDVSSSDASLLMSEPNVCRGLNMCKSKGRGSDNACAGQGGCASAQEHACKSENACKGQGGCGETPGENACKGQGGCQVPLSKEAWTKARARFEQVLKAAGKDIGPAPEPAGS